MSIDKNVTQCMHDRIILHSEADPVDMELLPSYNPKDVYFWGSCINGNCGTTMLRTFENYEATDKQYNNWLIYKRK